MLFQEERRVYREEIRREVERNRIRREYGMFAETARKFAAEIGRDATRLWSAVGHGLTAKVSPGQGRGKS